MDASLELVTVDLLAAVLELMMVDWWGTCLDIPWAELMEAYAAAKME